MTLPPRIVFRLFAVLAVVLLGVWIASCAPQTSLTHWPARDALYARYCTLEVRQGRIPFSAFEDCVHRLTAHRGDVCTHERRRAGADEGVTPTVAVQHDEQRSEGAIDAPRELGREIRGERAR